MTRDNNTRNSELEVRNLFCKDYISKESVYYSTSRCLQTFPWQVFGKSIMIGLCITLFAGICLSLFSPAFNLATNDQWSTLPKGVPKLVVYTAFFYFSIAGFLIALILNLIFLYRPMVGLERSSLKKYVNDSKGRGWAVFAGFLCGFGNGLQFMGGQAAGYAAADSVQVSFCVFRLIDLKFAC